MKRSVKRFRKAGLSGEISGRRGRRDEPEGPRKSVQDGRRIDLSVQISGPTGREEGVRLGEKVQGAWDKELK